MIIKKRALVLLMFSGSLTVANVADAGSTDCSDVFYAGQAPDLVNLKITRKARELCFSEFAVMHSGLTRTPLYSAEHLTRARIEKARRQHRDDAGESFHEEERLPDSERSWLSDYSRSGFDRGHLSPNGDFDNPTAQGESFSLANMMPQNPQNNRNLWEGVEEATRAMAVRNGEIWVVTVPIFAGEETRWLHDRVAVPSQIAKAIYVPSRGILGAYLVNNTSGMQWTVISIARLEQLSGIDAFPGVEASRKSEVPDLPEPTPRSARKGRGERSLESEFARRLLRTF